MLSIRYRLLAVCCVAACGFAVYAGVYSAIRSLFETRDFEYARANMADLEIRFAADDAINLPSFANTPGVTGVEPRLLIPGHLSRPTGHPLTAVLITIDPTHHTINRLQLLRGSMVARADVNGVVIERNLARYHGYDIGDELNLTVNGESYRLRVRGIALSPEFLISSANPSVFVPTKGSLGVIFALPELIEERWGYRQVNSLLFTLAPPTSASRTISEMEVQVTNQAATALTVDETVSRTHQFGYRFLELDLHAFEVFLPALVIVIGLTSFLLVLFLIFQWVTSERQQIGTLMALGYDKRWICAAYLCPALVITVASVGFGVVLAVMTSYVYAFNSAEAIGFPRPHVLLARQYVVWGVAGMAATVAAASVWPQLWLLRLTPFEAVRNMAGSSRCAVGPVARLLSRLRGRAFMRYALRNIMRHKGVSAMTIIVIASSLGVAASFFIALSSFYTTAVDNVEDDRWNATVDFFAPVWNDHLASFAALPGIDRAVPYVKGVAQVVTAGRERENAYVLGLPPDSMMRQLNVVAGRDLAAGDSRAIVLERKLATSGGVRVGDLVHLAFQDRRLEVTLVGVFSGALPGEAYMPLTSARELFDLDERSTGLFLVTQLREEQLARSLYAMKDVAHVTSKRQVVSDILQTTGHIAVIIRMGAGFSIAIAVMFIFCSVSFTVLQRKGEYVMLRILGFSARTVAATIVCEVLVIGLLAALIAVPIGYESATFLNARLSAAWFTVNTRAQASDFVQILLPALLLMPVAAWPAIRAVLSESLSGSLREKRFG